MNLDDCKGLRYARARVAISDSPLSDGADAARGAVGEVCDVDICDGIVFVDFGRGAIACLPSELLPT